MSDFIARLRAASDDASLDCYSLCEEAADRIEALEAALRLIDNVSTDYVAIKIARGTLAAEHTASEYEEIFKHLRKDK